jgi:serine/threonine protein phosphatase PrpC
VAAGVSCVAAGEESVYLAQVAPAAAVVMRGGVTEIIKPSLPESRQSLGLEQDPRPEFTALGLETGDRVLLVSPELTDALTEDDFAAVLDSTEENALTELYRRAQGITECAALLIAVVPDPPGGG